MYTWLLINENNRLSYFPRKVNAVEKLRPGTIFTGGNTDKSLNPHGCSKHFRNIFVESFCQNFCI